MWQLITKYFPTHPPALYGLQGFPFTEETNPQAPPKWTHGGLLLNPVYARHHDRLRSIILWCMMDRPDDRPSPDQLEWEIGKGLQETKSPGNIDIVWGQDFFSKPPPAKGPEMVKSLPYSRGQKRKNSALIRQGASAPVRPEFSAEP